jgi:hypothetical protein
VGVILAFLFGFASETALAWEHHGKRGANGNFDFLDIVDGRIYECTDVRDTPNQEFGAWCTGT